MSSSQSLREFIRERLTAAAAEIFSEFEQTIVRYEEEIDRQRRLLEISWKPQINLHRIELPLHYVRTDEEVLTDQQLWNQERTSSLEQEEPEPLPILEHEELCIRQDKEQLVTSDVTPTDEERDQDEPKPNTHQRLLSMLPESGIQNQDRTHHLTLPELRQHPLWKKEILTDQQLCSHETTSSLDQEEPEPPLMKEEQRELCISQPEGQLILKQEYVTFMVTSPSAETDSYEPEPSNNQLSCLMPPEAENRDRDGCRNENSDSSRNEALTRNDQGDGQKLKKHSREKRVSCTICGRSFSGNRCLGIHMRMHKRKKPQPCKICGKCYSLWKPFNTHMMAHERRKEYPCEICGERFFLISIWASHMKTHTREEPRSCMFCGKRFFSNRNMTSHMRTHRLDAISM
uniref:C2H2-type domain-containing protein n=1 Tax=Nothobranchius kadleci TaxID=1051664 RepID=A0A1A8CYJ2_NOTKA